jgi:acyl carrier protein
MTDDGIKVNETLKTLITNIMGIDADTVPLDKKISEISEWDSFNNLMLIAEVEKKFGIKYTAQELSGIMTIKQIIESIKNKLR